VWIALLLLAADAYRALRAGAVTYEELAEVEPASVV
jgi:hypothetical protein